jgi:long-subunit fatty acid transport protein
MGRCGIGFVLVAMVLAITRHAAASPQEVLGFGHRSIAMGTTGAASAEDFDAVYQNPALLSTSRHRALQLGLEGALFNLRADGPMHAGRVGYSPLKASTIGLTLPLPFTGILKDRIALGLGFVTPLDLVVRGRILYPEKPQFLLADRVQSVALHIGLGAELGGGVRIGGGFSALAALKGSVLVQTDASGRIGTLVQDTLIASYAPLAGASWEFSNATYRIGVAVRGKLVGRFNVVITADNLGGLNIPPLNISGVAQYDPWQVAAEIAKVRGPWRAAVGATYKRWSDYPGPADATVRCEDSPVPTEPCAAPVPAPAGYHDVVAPRAGIERLVPIGRGSHVALRAGYAFEPSPAPAQIGRRNYFDNARSVVSAGWGLVLGGAPLGFDGFAQVHVLHPRDHAKLVSEGASEDGVVATGGFIVAVGVAASARF